MCMWIIGLVKKFEVGVVGGCGLLCGFRYYDTAVDTGDPTNTQISNSINGRPTMFCCYDNHKY